MTAAVRLLGRVDYGPTADAMRRFTEERDAQTPDEIWLCEHPPVYTQGIGGKTEHVLDAGGIPVVATNRGGQVTYHGPGQVVAYPLIDLRRLGIYVKEYVFRLEQAVLKTLEAEGITGHRVRGAPGIYVRLADPSGHAALNEAEQAHFAGLGVRRGPVRLNRLTTRILARLWRRAVFELAFGRRAAMGPGRWLRPRDSGRRRPERGSRFQYEWRFEACRRAAEGGADQPGGRYP